MVLLVAAGDHPRRPRSEAAWAHLCGAAGELWRFCFSRGRGTHAEFIAGLRDRMTANAETIDWWERGAPRGRQ